MSIGRNGIAQYERPLWVQASLLVPLALALGWALTQGSGLRLTLLLIAVAGVIVLLTGQAMRSDGEWLVAVVLLLSGLVGMPAGVVQVGEVSGLGLLTIGYVAIGAVMWLVRPVLPHGAMAPFLAFLAWAGASLVLHESSLSGVQNILVALAFVLLATVIYARVPLQPSLRDLAGRWLGRAVFVACSLYLVAVAVDGINTDFLVGEARGFAPFAVVGLAWTLAGWRYRLRYRLAASVAIVGVVLLSLSRAALVTALVLFVLTWFDPRSGRSWIRTLAVIGMVIVAASVVFSRFEPLRDRFTTGNIERVGGFQVNVSGRFNFWEVTFRDYRRSPVTGLGAGSAQELTQRVFGICCPHNEFLRILHDYGLVGISLWGLALLYMGWRLWRNWAASDGAGDPHARTDLAAFLAMAAVTIMMPVDNIGIYVFVMAPLGILIGSALGRQPSPDREPATRDGRALQPERARARHGHRRDRARGARPLGVPTVTRLVAEPAGRSQQPPQSRRLFAEDARLVWEEPPG